MRLIVRGRDLEKYAAWIRGFQKNGWELVIV